MPGTSKAKSPSGIEIVFEELTHKYTSEVNGKQIKNYSVIDRFIRSGKFPYKQVKSIVNLKKTKNTMRIAGHKTEPIAPIDVDPKNAYIAHYMVKTWEEFSARRIGKDSMFYGKIDAFKNNDIKKVKAFFDGKN